MLCSKHLQTALGIAEFFNWLGIEVSSNCRYRRLRKKKRSHHRLPIKIMNAPPPTDNDQQELKFAPDKLAHNNSVLYFMWVSDITYLFLPSRMLLNGYSRICGSVVSGMAAGVLGLKSINGAIFYLASYVFLSFLATIKIGGKVDNFFPESQLSIAWNGVFVGALVGHLRSCTISHNFFMSIMIPTTKTKNQ